jgi:hypothetical protein
MKRVITIFCLAAGFMLLMQQAQAQYGIVIYSGSSSADLYMGKLTDPNYSKVEFFRGAKKLGEITMNGPNGGIVTDYGLAKGQPYQYEFRAWRTAGGFLQGQCALGYVIGGDIRGILTRKDTIAIKTDLIDSVFIYPGGPVNSEVIVPGGELWIAPGGDLSYNVSMSGKISGIRIFDTSDPKYPPGKFCAIGGKLNDVNIECYGQVGPLYGLTFIASDVRMYSDYPTVMENCTLEWTTAQQRFDHAYIDHRYWGITAKKCLVRNNSEFLGVKNAEECTIEFDGILIATNATKCIFKDNGQLSMRPANAPTSCTYNMFKGGSNTSSLSISNYSEVKFNTFETGTILTCASQSLFDPLDIKNIHINFNDFQRQGTDAALLSTRDVDTIDATMNYWGQCTGPSNSERIGRTAHFDPFLRVRYPGTSYWFDITPDKKAIVADGEDEVVFTGHFYNTLAGIDSVGATVTYLVRCIGDTVAAGTLTTDANGMVTLRIKLPQTYNTAIAMEVYFKSIQCIEKAFYISVSALEGPDLEIFDASIVQSVEGASAIIAHKPYIVKATITTTEAVTTPFPVQVKIGTAVYDTFYVSDKVNRNVQYQVKNPMTKIALPRSESPTLYFFVDDVTHGTGSLDVQVIVDPPDAQHPKGFVVEANDNNNTKSASATLKSSRWGNEGGPNFSVFMQPLDYPINLPISPERLTRYADSALYFIESSWPMQKGQVSFSKGTPVDYSWIFKDTLRTEDWQYYLVKAYKQMRLANPAFDRYAFVVPPDWFGTRLHPVDFAHRLSQGLSWSGIYDFSLCSHQSFYYLVHGLGHSFGLRRGDFKIEDPDIQEENMNFFIGKEVYDSWDFYNKRMLHTGMNNEVSRLMKAYCFMGNSRISSPELTFYTWICDVDYFKLLGSFASFNGSGGSMKKATAAKAVFIEGIVDSTTKAFAFGPWARLDNATPSNMVDSAYATHVFRFLDASDVEVSRYYYRPTFTALGLDEGADAPWMSKEYFAFVAPLPENVKKVRVEKDGNLVVERTVTTNPPVVNVIYPTEGGYVPEGPSFTASWGATDPDGETEFWYTVYISVDKGVTWKLVTFESKDVQAILKLPKGFDYKIKVIANDGINSSEKTVTFNIATGIDESSLANDFVLYQNYPNPFNPVTMLRYSVPIAAHVSVVVYDALGRPIETLFNGFQTPGSYRLEFNGASHPSGTYTAVLRAGTRTSSIRMVLSK